MLRRYRTSVEEKAKRRKALQSNENADENYDPIMAARGTLSGSTENIKGSAKMSMEQHKTEVNDEV